MEKEEESTIRLSKTTKLQIKSLGNFGETYESVIKRYLPNIKKDDDGEQYYILGEETRNGE